MVDYLVIGAGVYGTATAWWLAQAGASVRVLDERGIATRASGGPGRRGVRANGRDVRELPLMRYAYDVWPSLHERLGAAPFYERVGQLLLAETAVDLERARARAWMQTRLGIRTELLAAGAVREFEPEISTEIIGALYCPDDGVANHSATTHAFAAAGKALGVEVTTDCGISEIETRSERANAVITRDGERIEAARGIFLLTNASVAELLKPWTHLPVWNECLQVLVSEPMTEVPFKHLTGHMSRTISVKLEGTHQVMVSGGWRGRWDAAAQEGYPIDEAVAANVAEAAAVYPALADMQIAVADASHQESRCIDDIPTIDRIEGLDNLWYATGWCGHGWAIAPVVTELLAEWALTGARPSLLQPFSLQRFS